VDDFGEAKEPEVGLMGEANREAPAREQRAGIFTENGSGG
jgi:hypothetical protein